MFGIEGLEFAHLIQIGYVLIGLLVSYWHIERTEMKKSLRTARVGFHHVGNLAWYLLALIWPVLLFAYMVEPKRDQKESGD